MKLLIVAVGQRLPGWAQQACDDYAKRLAGGLRLEIKTVAAEVRGSKSLPQMLAAERRRIDAAIKASCGKDVRLIAMDERGEAMRTQDLANKLRAWQLEGTDLALLLGGPDGLDPELKGTAHESIRLSDLTLPHALARVLLIEQIYRAWSINNNHPYHRE